MDHVDVFPVSLLTHPVVELSFVDTWRHGLHGILRSNSQTVAQRAWEKLDASCTPRYVYSRLILDAYFEWHALERVICWRWHGLPSI